MGRVSTRGGRKQSAGVLREMKTQSEDCTQRARAAPKREGGVSWGTRGGRRRGGSTDVFAGGGHGCEVFLFGMIDIMVGLTCGEKSCLFSCFHVFLDFDEMSCRSFTLDCERIQC